MPAGHIIPPGSAQDFAQQQAALRAAADEQKLRQGIQAGFAPVYVKQASAQLGIGVVITDLTGLAGTVLVGTRRLVRITGFVSVQKQTTKAAAVLYISEGASQFESTPQSLDGTTGDLGTLICTFVVSAPTAGTHTYKLQAACGSGTVDATPSGYGPSFILIEDIGLAPA